MSKPYHSLPEALRGIISEMGDYVIEDIKLVNILADVCSLEDIPAANNILKKMLSDGYGKEIISILANPSWEIKMKMLSSRIASRNGFREEITQYIIDSFVYGLGKTDKLPKSIITSSNPPCSITDLEIELKKLKGDYITFLDENVMTADDEPASFNTDDKSEIYEYREKIRILSEALGKKDLSWCDDRMTEILEKYAPKPKGIKRKGFLKRLFGS